MNRRLLLAVGGSALIAVCSTPPLPFAAGRVGHLHALRRLIDEVAG